MDKKYNLIWVDTELTGLDFSNNQLLEIAVIITDKNLNILDKGLNLVIHQNEDVLKNMDQWCKDTFSKSGLIGKVRNSELSIKEAEELILNYVKQYTLKGEAPMCGSSIGQDRKVLARLMFEFEENWCDHRSIDVSSIKELARRWKPEILSKVEEKKRNEHSALKDIEDSIEELKIYKKEFFMI